MDDRTRMPSNSSFVSPHNLPESMSMFSDASANPPPVPALQLVAGAVQVLDGRSSRQNPRLWRPPSLTETTSIPTQKSA